MYHVQCRSGLPDQRKVRQTRFVMLCQSSRSSMPGFTHKLTETVARLAALGDTALDVVPLNVVSVVGLDISSETI